MLGGLSSCPGDPQGAHTHSLIVLLGLVFYNPKL